MEFTAERPYILSKTKNINKQAKYFLKRGNYSFLSCFLQLLLLVCGRRVRATGEEPYVYC